MEHTGFGATTRCSARRCTAPHGAARRRRSLLGHVEQGNRRFHFARAMHSHHPFPPIGDAAYRQHAGGGPSHGHRQHAQKFGKDRSCGCGDILAERQTDTQTDILVTILRNRSCIGAFAAGPAWCGRKTQHAATRRIMPHHAGLGMYAFDYNIRCLTLKRGLNSVWTS